jgi:hypothetical protein
MNSRRGADRDAGRKQSPVVRAQVLVIEGATLACASIARAFSPTFHVEAASSWRAGRQLMTRPFVGLVVDLDMPPAGAALEFRSRLPPMSTPTS